MVEFIAWQIKLALVDYRRRVGERITFIMRHSRPWIGDESRFDRLVDRLSPFDTNDGFHNLFIRRFLYTARSPIVFARLRSLELSLALLQRITPYVGPGKFEAMRDPRNQLKAEWLYDHSEHADRMVGDLTVYPLYNWLYADADVPWSRQPESWVMEADEMGFVIALQYDDAIEAEIAFGGAEYRFYRWDEDNADVRDEDEVNEAWFENREGQPEFNGAFG